MNPNSQDRSAFFMPNGKKHFNAMLMGAMNPLCGNGVKNGNQMEQALRTEDEETQRSQMGMAKSKN
jgi:hypothetical protein